MQAVVIASRRVLSAQPVLAKSTAARSVVTFMDSHERADWELSEFLSYTRNVGQDDFPYYRKTNQTPSQKRAMRVNKFEGRESNKKVRGLVRFIQLKQDMKYV
jgi:hypothetical protein